MIKKILIKNLSGKVSINSMRIKVFKYFIQNLKKIKFELILLLLAIILVTINLEIIKDGDLIFSGDQYYPFSLNEVKKNIFEIINFKNLGTIDGWSSNINFFDNIVFYVLYKLKINEIYLQYFYHFSIFYLIIRLSIIGFKRFSTFFDLNLKDFQLLSVTLLYSTGPYFVQLLHGTVMNISVALSYSLSPIIFVLFLEYFMSSRADLKLCTILSLLIYIALFPFWFFASFGLLLIMNYIYILIFVGIRKKIIIKSFILFLTLVPLISYELYNIFFHKIAVSGINPNIDSPVFGNIHGGILYQLKMIHSWGIYNIWNPRYHYPFGAHYFSNIYNLTIVFLYGCILFGIYKFFKANENKSLQSLLIFFLITFFISIFLAKGPSGFYGNIYIYLYENLPFFSVFRTPDIRFGFIIILILSFIILLISKNNKFFINPTYLIIVTIILSLPLFNGEALKGKNISNLYFDKVIKIPKSYLDAADFINKNTSKYDFVFDLDMIDYGVFHLDNDTYAGQDIFSKIITSPMVYGGRSNPIPIQTIENLNKVQKDNDFELLKNYPIKYIILRKNSKLAEKLFLTKNLIIAFENSTFLIYELKNHSQIIDACGNKFINYGNYSFIVNLEQFCENITLRLSYDRNWRIIDLGDNYNLLKVILIQFENLFNNKGINPSPNFYYQNKFSINLESSNYSKFFLIYYEPNFISKFLLIISFSSVFIYLLAIYQNFVKSLMRLRFRFK